MANLPPVPTPTNVVNGDGVIFGTAANDQINAGNNANVIYAGDGDDLAYGGSGDDLIYGGNGNDYLYGSNGANALYGQAGNDVLYGGDGNDLLVGGPGDDVLYGGGGSNIAMFEELYRAPVITSNSDGSLSISGSDGNDTLYQAGTLRFLDGTATTDTASSVAQAYRLYQAAFNRAPDTAGLAFFTGKLDQGVSLDVLAQSFLGSSEFQARYTTGGDTLSNAQYVDQLYQNVLGRSSSNDPTGASFWQQQLDTNASTKAQVLARFSESAENIQHTAAAFTGGIFVPSQAAIDVVSTYRAVLGHGPDAAGLAYWSDKLQNNAYNATPVSVAQIADSLIKSSEFQASANSSNAAFAQLIVTNAEGANQPNATSYWTGQLDAHSVSRAGMVQFYVDAPEVRAAAVPSLANGYAPA